MRRMLLLVVVLALGADIRKMIVGARGRLWYMGSHNGRLGVIE